MSGGWGTALFRNVALTVFFFYLLSVMLFMTGLYFAVETLGFKDFFLIISVGFVLAAIAGAAIAKLAIEPLREHFEQLEQFSKETLHELNLPINTITANTKMLRKTYGDEKSLRRIGRIETACEMLRSRYSELDYLIKRQMQRESIETFDLRDLLEERIALLRALYRGAEISADLESLSVNMDRMGLAKVIDNLIDNAVKYSTPPAQITVTLKNSRLSIEDKGRGMDEVELFKIFDRYYQSDESMPGFGIGLGLVKTYCDKHRIKLHVSSKRGVGTAMTLEFKGVD
jgi:two-component system OmpR family sensor kinase